MLKLVCPKHPKYTAKFPPRASCEPCQALYSLRAKAYMEKLRVGGPEPKEKE